MEGKVIRTKVPIAQPGVISIIEDTEEVYICFEDGSVKKLVSVVTDQNKPADFLLDVQSNTIVPAYNLGGYAKIVYSDSEPENPTVGTIWVKEDGISYIYDGVEWSKINRLTSEDVGISLDLSLFPFTTNISFSTSGLTVSWGNSTITVIQPNNNINFSVSSGSTNLSANKTYYIFAQLNTNNNTASIVFSEQAPTTANTLLIGGAKTDSSRVIQVFVGTIVQKQEIDTLSGLISATQLGKEVQPYVSSVRFSATSSTAVSYTSGSIRFLDGSSYSVSSGSFTISQDGVYYIYFQISGSSVTLNVSTNIADSVGANKGLLAVCTRANNTISVLPFSSGGGTINSNLIAANAITANHIQANSISSDHITSSAITSDKIAANAVTSDKIAANAVVADKIAANAVTAEKLAASTTRFWYADNLQFSIVSSKIRATFTTLAIYSGKDVTEATATSPIDSDTTVSDGNWYLWYDYDGATKFKISTATTVNSNFQPNADLLIAKIVISGGQISQVVNLFNGTVIDGAVIKTDTIEARHIKANSISADKLAVGTIGNLLPYKYATFEAVDVGALREASNNSSITTTTTAFDGSQAISASLSTTQFVVIPYGNDVILVNPNTVYTFSAACRRSSTGTSSLVIEILNAADNSVIASSTTSISTTYTRCAVSFTAPSSGRVKFRFRTTSSTAATIFIDACQLEEGNIPAASIRYRPPAVTYIDGSQIVTGAITADKISAGAVTAEKISVSQLSSISANLGTVTAGTLQGVNIIAGSVDSTTTIAGTSATSIASTVTNFSGRYQRISTTPATPSTPTITATNLSNASADLVVSFTFSGSGDSVKIDGFRLEVSSADDSAFTQNIRTSTFLIASAGTGSYSFSVQGVAPNRYYRARVLAYRLVDADINSSGYLLSDWSSYSSVVQPSSAPNYTGNIANISASSIAATHTNFNNRNDRISTTPATPSVGTPVVAARTDGSCDISFPFTFSGSGDAYNIDGFEVEVISSSDAGGTQNVVTEKTTIPFSPGTTSYTHAISGVTPDRYYRMRVRAFRVVDPDINPNQIIFSSWATSSTTTPQTPNYSGNIAGVAAGSVVNTAKTAFVFSNVKFSISGSTLSWTSGSVYLADGSTQAITSGSYNVTTTGTHWVYGTIGSSSLSVTTNPSSAAGSDKFVLAICLRKSDGSILVTSFASSDDGLIVANKLSAVSADIGNVTAGNISGVNISGATITGGTVRTAASGKRIEMLSNYANTIFGYSGDSEERNPGELSFYAGAYNTGVILKSPAVYQSSSGIEYKGSVQITPKLQHGNDTFSLFGISVSQYNEDLNQTLGICEISGVVSKNMQKSYITIASESGLLKIRPDINNTRFMSNQPITFTNSGTFDTYTDYQDIVCKSVTAHGLIGNFPYHYQELSSDLALSAGSGWFTFTGNGISYLGIGNVSSGTIVDFSGAVRATTGDGSDYSIAAVITSGPSTVIKQFTVATLRSGQSGTIAFKYKFSNNYSDVRIYLRIWRGTSTTATIRAGTDPEKTTWMSATVYK